MPFISHRWLWTVAALLAIQAQSSNATEVKLLEPAHAWQMAEFRIEDGPIASNNFDPEQIRIEATFSSGSGKSVTVPAFWYEDFTRALVNGAEVLKPRGKGEWRVRYTPSDQGNFSVSVVAQRGTSPATKIADFSFRVAPPAETNHIGWIKLSADKSSFETSEGKLVRLIGANVCWSAGQGTYDFERWFEHMEKTGQNYARLWLSPWSLAIEHTPDALNRYHQDAAWQLDAIFRAAEAHRIYLQLCFDHHGMYSVGSDHWDGSNNFWTRNPYSRAAGGPCETPNDFFTNGQARTFYQKRLRYLIARYAYSAQLLGWEFFNEIDNVFQPEQQLVPADVIEWHRVMGKWIRENDPFHHLVTSSLTGGSDRTDFWSLPELEFTAYHSYNDAAPARTIAAVSQDFTKRYKKPVMIGEFGTSSQSWDIAHDPHLRGFRQGLWGAALGGSVGTAMSWWWENLETDGVYPLYSVFHDVMQDVGWHEAGWKPIPIATDEFAPAEVGEPLPGVAPFTASIALADFRRIPLSGKLALANPLAAERAGEQLSGFLLGTNIPEIRRPIALSVNLASDAKLTFTVNSAASDVTIVVKIDGREKLRLSLAERDGKKSVNYESDQVVAVDLPPGKHAIEISNQGMNWALIEKLTLSRVQPSAFAGGWNFHPEFVGLRNDDLKRAVLYLNSPYVAWPAGAVRYNPPTLSGQHVTLRDWPAGKYQVKWIKPSDGSAVADTEITANSSELRLLVPPINDDLVAVIRLSP